jgi:probable phosphoglycerate mutase
MIYLLRHGQTAMNAARRYQGRIDSPLTERGRAQAQAMARALAGGFDPAACVLLCSPLGRARQTAGIVAETLGAPPPEVLEDLTEVAMGAWEGLTAEQIDDRWPGARKAGLRNEWFFRAPGGEDHASVAARLSRALATAAARPEPVRILVSHAIAGRVLRGLYAGLPMAQALRLEIPQEALFALPGAGRIVRIPCPG